MRRYDIVVICQNCGLPFEINKYYFKRRQKANKVFCKDCAKTIMLKEADYHARHETYVKTCLKLYGVDNAAKLDSVIQKHKETNLKLYGEENYCSFGTKSFTDVLQNKYGIDNAAKLDFVIKKREDTLTQRTGFAHALQVPKYYEKQKIHVKKIMVVLCKNVHLVHCQKIV